MNERKALEKSGKLRCSAKANSSGVYLVGISELNEVCVARRRATRF